MKPRIMILMTALLLCLTLVLCACGETVSVVGSHWNELGELILEMSDGTTVNAGSPASVIEEAQGLAFHRLEDGTWGVTVGTADLLEEITVPATHQGSPVTAVLAEGFAGVKARTVRLPDTVTVIRDKAFAGSELTAMELPASLKSIGEAAFQNCDRLLRISLPAALTQIGQYAFSGCEKLVEVENNSELQLSAGNDRYGYVAYYAQNLYTPKKGESKLIFTDDGYVFLDVKRCFLLDYWGEQTALTLPADCNGKPYNVYRYAFYGRDDLTAVTLSEGTTIVGERAFMYCTSLREVVLPETMTLLGDYAFAWCAALERINLPSALTEWGANAFYRCDRLKRTEENVIYIGTIAVDVAVNGEPFTLRGDTTAIYNQAFSRVTTDAVILPDGLESIGAEAFYLTSAAWIYVPASVTYMDSSAFASCRTPIVYYGGTERGSLWKYVSLPTDTVLYCYSETAPTTKGNFWYCDAEGNIQVW